MNNIDSAIQTFLFHHAAASPLVNHVMRVVAGQIMFKGLVLVPVLCFIWFRDNQRKAWEREMIVATVASGMVSLALGRALAACLPFRTRPLFDDRLHSLFPSVGLDHTAVSTWSSFPSDHAMLWMSVAAGIFLIWRSAGVLALLYTIVFICLPRIYLGLHYPTDIIVGAAIGILIAFIATRDAVRPRFAVPILQWIQRSPGIAYTLAFLLFFELVTQFDEALLVWHAAIHSL